MEEWKRKWKLQFLDFGFRVLDLGFRVWGLGFRVWGGNEGMEKKMKTTMVGYIGTTIRIHSFNFS